LYVLIQLFVMKIRSVLDEVLHLDRQTAIKRIGAFYKFVILTLVFAPEECPALMTTLCKCFMKIGRYCSIILWLGCPIFGRLKFLAITKYLRNYLEHMNQQVMRLLLSLVRLSPEITVLRFLGH
jgi:hypothetical protein